MKHMKKRVAALLLTLAMVLSLAPMAFAADEFPDMPAEDDPSYAAVKSAVDNEIMTGENGALNLEGTILRSTVAKMVVTAFAAKGEADLSGYPDVTDGAWYAEWMAKANQMGIMSGTSGRMNPGSKVTLAEVATMLVRALGLSVDEDATVEGVASWAAPYVKALIDANYITAEDAAAAHEPMTRVAFAEVIYKVSGEGNYAKEENAEITTDVNGNIVITANGVSLKGITVTGDVIIADGVDADTVTLDNVKVEGRVVVRGAGANLTNGTTASATVVAATSGETTVKADTSSKAGDIAVAGTNGQSADKVVIDMAEPKVTVSTATEVAVQNANGGEVTLTAANASLSVESGTVDSVTLQAPNASLSVESGTVGNVTVADGASGVKVDVAEGATIDKVTTNTDLAITGEGTVTEKEGSGTVTDAAGNEVSGSDEPVDVPTVSDTAADPVDSNAPTNAVHTHQYSTTPTQFDATRHVYTCADVTADAENGVEAFEGCGAVRYENHNTNGDEVKNGETVIGHKCTCGYSAVVTSSVDEGDGENNCADGKHTWKALTGEAATEAGDTAATCEDAGQRTYACSVEGCTATKTETLPATDHNLVAFKSTAATCKVDGKTYFKCSNDDCTEGADDSVYKVIPATGNHDWKLTATVAATCATEGHYTYTCTVCSSTDSSKTIAKNPALHNFTASPTNNGDGTHTLSCAVSGCDVDSTTDGAQAATKTEPHKLVKVTTGDAADLYKAPTCTEAGHEAAMKCSVCTYKVAGAEIPATGHTAASSWSKNATHHWHGCTNCATYATNGTGATGYAEHDWADEGHTACSTCGWTKTGGSGEGGGQTAEHKHNWVNGKCTSTTNLPNGQEKCNETITSETCPDHNSHSDPATVNEGETICSKCGLKGTKKAAAVDPQG